MILHGYYITLCYINITSYYVTLHHICLYTIYYIILHHITINNWMTFLHQILCEKQGYLHKLDPRLKHWTRRWFVLKGKELKYFSKVRQKRPIQFDI